jgi:hypothetical protein
MREDAHHQLRLGDKYSKQELSKILREPTLKTVREGVFYGTKFRNTLLFVDLEKEGKEERFHFNDYFEGEFFHWDSQTTQHPTSPKIREIVEGRATPLLFVRLYQKVKSKTQPFVYCVRLEFAELNPQTSKPVHLIFRNLDYDDYTQNDDLTDLYLWKPNHSGKETSNTVSKSAVVSDNRKSRYQKPTKTERKGLVVSRVGQGYYRQQVIEKWNGVCPVTKLEVRRVLIASHIKRWSESSDEERLDPENGILLSPNFDSLFDRHLVSFTDEGHLVRSSRVTVDDLIKMGINAAVVIPISDGMKKYLDHHRERVVDPLLNGHHT